MKKSVIVDVNAFLDGFGNLGTAVSFKPPALKQKRVNSSTAAGDVSYAIGQFESLDSEMSFASVPRAVFDVMAKTDDGEVILKKAIKEGSETRNHMWTLTGAIDIEYGEAKAGEMLDVKVSQTGLKKYVYEIDNTLQVKIDHENLICEIAGKDLLADTRQILNA